MPTHRRTHISRAVTAATLLALTAACTSGSSDRPEERAPESGGAPYEGLPDELGRQSLDWTSCPAASPSQDPMATAPPDELAEGAGWECADLEVPLDYGQPEGDTIELALIRARAGDGAERIGSLVFNFGGPGGSGVATLPAAGESFDSLREGGYDLVSFDPRGVGESEGIVCLSDAERDAAVQELGSLPETDEEREIAERQEREFIAACEENSGHMLRHVSTANAARDLDLMRHVLGDDALYYFGVSYGTQLGATYANLFPDKVGRTVLDAVVDPDDDPVHQGLLNAMGFQRALDHYLEDCVQQSDCPAGENPADGNLWISDLLTDLEDAPLPTTDASGRDLTVTLAFAGIISTLYSEDSWEYLTLALEEVRDQSTGDLLLLLSDLYNERNPATGEYSTQEPAFTAIRCADQPGGLSEEEALSHQDEFVEASQVFGPYMVWSLGGCGDHWPVTEAADPPNYDATDSAEPLLLLGTAGDPATPIEGAERMREAMGGPETAPLLRWEGEGHGAYLSESPCVVEAVDAWLLNGEIPPDDTTCPA
ncbi:alpha/beta hydrolase [Streptomyces sedi]|uniref:Alpha/beta hydrolase n=1 Tax=Streptomyces sedi TaxID=555059 RepID=A0A5C4VAG4_9ACTN|nr:alpha/beta hydrolase [Streptomyces sedi]